MSTRIAALLVSVGLALSSVVACGDNPAAPTENVSFSTTDLVVGSGATASTGQTLTVAYTGWLYEEGAADNKGAQFDQTSAESPFSFVLGSGQVIAGWDQGLEGMKVGGRRRLVIPPALAYGTLDQLWSDDHTYRTLIFEVELLGVN